MGLTFKKRDDLDQLMENLGVSGLDDILSGADPVTKDEKPAEDPFAKFLAPKEEDEEAGK
ncbi:SPJ_0845 family protein [Lactococcus termiticola]|uniref:Uncharacterized protein n=1 Tax=Lactococcus termiticola TaxID=2169526 RepID=A0A2R5HKD8_9LACT|nr:SPJ_0845 family protein [Lactococcus termiticola]GBG97001.1 hypothetical protein NtB2_01138 [Lactococcus termiticola]